MAAIDVFLTTCPRGEVPPQIECGSEQFAQLVIITFEAAPPGGPMEPSLTVAVAPVSGTILGIANPLVPLGGVPQESVGGSVSDLAR